MEIKEVLKFIENAESDVRAAEYRLNLARESLRIAKAGCSEFLRTATAPQEEIAA